MGGNEVEDWKETANDIEKEQLRRPIVVGHRASVSLRLMMPSYVYRYHCHRTSLTMQLALATVESLVYIWSHIK